MTANYTAREREISRAIHRLYLNAFMVDKTGLAVCLVTRLPAMFIYNVFIPFVVAYGLQAIITQNFGVVGQYAWLVIGLGFAYCALWAVGGVFICRNGRLGAQHVQREIFANYLQKDYEFYNNTYLGALGAQATRAREAFNEYSQLMLLNIPKQIIIVAASVLIIAFQSLLLAAVTLVAMGLVLSYTILSSRWRLRYRRKLSEESSKLAGVIGDALGHGATVKSFAAEAYEKTRLNKILNTWSLAQYRAWISSIPADVGRMILAAIATAILLVLTAKMYQEGQISIAIVILVQLYVVKLITATLDIAEIIKSYEVMMGGAYDALKTMLVKPEIVDAPRTQSLPKNVAEVAFQNVTYKYADANTTQTAVSNFDLTIKPGEKVGLVGYSGSGKTTLTKLLLRFMDINDGAIKLGEHDIREVKQRALRERIAYVPQEPLLFHRSIAENIAYGRPTASDREVMDAAKAAHVDEFVKDLPKGYDTLVGERGVKLSGGQRQRVAIARALLKDAPILVLDEATSALDSRSEKLIQQALWRLMKNRTALVIAHRLSTIQRMDRIVVMDKGKIVQIGSHETLLKDKKGIYAELWAHQSGGYVGVPNKDELSGGVTA